MKLFEFSFVNFRNLAEVRAAPHPQFTVIAGENGQGKTNLLEGIYYLLSLKPLRPAKPNDLLRLGQPQASLEAKLERGGVVEQIGLTLSREGREIVQNGKPVQDLGRYFEGGAVVAFTPDDLALVRGAPDRRRRFLDRAVFNRWPAFLEESREYQRLLRSRNRLLQEHAPRELRESFEGPLAVAGAKLIVRRRAWLTEVGALLKESFDRIGRLPVGLTATYPGPPQGNPAEITAWLESELDRKLEHDLERGFTSVGPHAGDLYLSLGDLDARRFASQGQARAVVLALKVAEIENLRARLGFPPLLLLDDVSSELDPERNRQLLDYLADLPAQVLLTTTDPSPLLPRLATRSALWRVAAGVVETS